MKIKLLLCLFFTLYFFNISPVFSATLDLSDNEKLFLSQNKEIRKCVDPHWLPMEGIKNNQHIGIIASMLSLIEKQLNISFTLVPTENWVESIAKLKAKECDILTSDAVTDINDYDYIHTQAFLNQKVVYITRLETPFQLDFSLIKDKAIGIPKGYPTINIIQQKYDNVNIVEVQDIDEGLLMVSKGELFAFVDSLPMCSYSIQKQHLSNLKVAGHIDIKVPTVMAVRADMPELVSILNKSFASLDDNTINEFFSEWIKVQYDTQINWQQYVIYGIFIIILFLLVLFWNRKLHKINLNLDHANEKLAQLNETDPLTHINNRFFLMNNMPSLISLGRRTGLSLGVAILDIDHFKKINDRYGHTKGDECLIAFAEQLELIFQRESDWTIRYGGEEFVVICMGMNKNKFIQNLERLRQSISKINLTTDKQQRIHFTVSIGYVYYNKIEQTWNEQLIDDADKFLYQVKRSGRNHIKGKSYDSDF